MKKHKVISCILCYLLLFSSFAYGEMNRPLTLKDLTKILVEDSLEVKSIDLNQRITIVRYRQTLEEYKKLKEKVENAGKSYKTMKENLGNISRGIASTPDDSPSKTELQSHMMSAIYTYMFVEEYYKELLQQEANMMRSLESMILIGKQADKRKTQAIEKAKHDLQKDYLNLVKVQEERKLLEDSITNLGYQIKIEEAKVELKLSTVIALETLKAQREDHMDGLQTLDSKTEFYLQALKTKLGLAVEDELNIVYEVPLGQLLLTNYDLARLIQDFKKNNLQLETLRRYASVQEEINEKLRIIYEDMNTVVGDTDLKKRNDDIYQSALLQLEEDLLNIIELERNYELAIKNLYNQYNRNMKNISLYRDKKQLAEGKYRQMEVLYQKGIISQQQLELAKQEVTKANYEYNMSFIDFINSRSEIELIVKGILPIQ